MRHIIRYKLHGGATPYYVDDGGHLPKDGYLIGLSKDDYTCDIPPHVEKLKSKDVDDIIESISLVNISTEDFKKAYKNKFKGLLEKHGGTYV